MLRQPEAEIISVLADEVNDALLESIEMETVSALVDMVEQQVASLVFEKKPLPVEWVNRWCEELQRARAIIDSGASYSYVPESVTLMNPRSGGGDVWVANGQKEEVKETGWLGPLVARKVSSFPRALISVRDLVDALGAIMFNEEGVHALTTMENDVAVTRIGVPLESRLYSFDLPAVIQHVHDITPVSLVGVR